MKKTGTSCGELSGHIRETQSRIKVSEVSLELDSETAYALCNILQKSALENSHSLEKCQKVKLVNLGAALGRIFGHRSQNNLENNENE